MAKVVPIPKPSRVYSNPTLIAYKAIKKPKQNLGIRHPRQSENSHSRPQHPNDQSEF